MPTTPPVQKSSPSIQIVLHSSHDGSDIFHLRVQRDESSVLGSGIIPKPLKVSMSLATVPLILNVTAPPSAVDLSRITRPPSA
jgi:hypothetical protein